MRPLRNSVMVISGVAVAVLLTGCGGGNGTNGSNGGNNGGNGGGGGGSTNPSVQSPGAVALDPTGKYAYVLEPSSHAIAQFAVHPDNSLSALTPPSVDVGTAFGAGAMTTVQNVNGTFAYLTNPVNDRVLQFSIGANGALTPLSPAFITNAGASNGGIVAHPSGQFVYTADSNGAVGSAHVSQYRVNADGTLSPLGPDVAVGFQIVRIAISPDGKWIFTNNNINGGQQGIQVLKINADGTLTVAADTGGSTSFIWLAVSPNSSNLYALGDNGLQSFHINADGSLTSFGSAATVPSASEFAMTPDGKFIYTPNPAGAGIGQTRVNADGTLTNLSPATAGSSGPTDFTRVSSDGKSLYASSRTDNKVTVFHINSDGTLTAQ